MTGLKARTFLNWGLVTKLTMRRLLSGRCSTIIVANAITTTGLPGSGFASVLCAAAGRRRVNQMIDTVSTAVQIFSVALSFGALLLLARAQFLKAQRSSEEQRVPIRVERDPREL